MRDCCYNRFRLWVHGFLYGHRMVTGLYGTIHCWDCEHQPEEDGVEDEDISQGTARGEMLCATF